jgi:hypothetical protein
MHNERSIKQVLQYSEKHDGRREIVVLCEDNTLWECCFDVGTSGPSPAPRERGWSDWERLEVKEIPTG